ncbi:hypothetical protein EJ06DRAFT_238919 [Trichodelitschia bisporula]|uniref:Uncharacterized protein n=1 Tax=Trichodelitschia bisporula TaxID=703511 RepID=A0A6G1HK75_9PEZI|nr:hypothetical protein EJ06DRAFT_238919 [Trichodelitschia bisporula]
MYISLSDVSLSLMVYLSVSGGISLSDGISLRLRWYRSLCHGFSLSLINTPSDGSLYLWWFLPDDDSALMMPR